MRESRGKKPKNKTVVRIRRYIIGNDKYASDAQRKVLNGSGSYENGKACMHKGTEEKLN